MRGSRKIKGKEKNAVDLFASLPPVPPRGTPAPPESKIKLNLPPFFLPFF